MLFADAVLAKNPQFVWRFANTGRGNPQIYYNVFPEEQQSNVGSIYVRFDHWETGRRPCDARSAYARS